MNENNSEQCNLSDSRFRVILFLLKIGGLTIRMKKISRIRSVYNSILHVCACITTSACVADLFVNRGEMLHFIKRMSLTSVLVLVCFQVVYLRLFKDTFERLISRTESFIWEDLPTRDPVTGKTTMAGWISRAQRMTVYVYCLSLFIYIVDTISRIVTYGDLMFSAWYPFDASTSPMYEFVLFTQLFSLLQLTSIYYVVPCIYVTFMCIAISQFEKLKHNILEIKQTHFFKALCTSEDVKSKKTYTEDNEVMWDMQRRLNECIRHHQQIIHRFMNTMEESFAIIFGTIFLFYLVGLCASLFTVAMALDNLITQFEPAGIYFIYLGTLFLYCSLGTELTEQAESVKHAVIGCDWVGTPLSFQRCLVFMITSCNKEFTLTAGKCAPVTNQTMMNMVNQSLSFFMFLLQMKDESDAGKSTK